MALSTSRTPAHPNDSLSDALARPFVVRWELLIYLVILLAAIFTRFWMLGERAMSHDESLHVYYSYNLYIKGDFDHTPLMHGPILFHANALMYALFGDSDFSGRIYTALLGVAMVFTPLLFRRWLGKWGALIACVLILISPLLMFYNRYIREDTPAIMASILMAWAILMYLNGPQEQRRKPRWLYVLSAALLWNLGTKETAFMYVASFGLFFTIYWIVRMLQVWIGLPGKPAFHGLMMSILIGATIAIPMYIILDIVPLDTLQSVSMFGQSVFENVESRSLIVWTVLAIGTVATALVLTALWAFRKSAHRFPVREIAILLVGALIVLGGLIFIEELSHVSNEAISTAAPLDPASLDMGASSSSGIRWSMIVAPWLIAGILIPLLIYSRRKNWWDWLQQFPELDVLIVMGALILPWLTAIFIVGAGGTRADLVALGNTFSGLEGLLPVTGPYEIGRFIVGLLCFLPLFTLAIVGGLTWNWRRFAVCWLIFHALFAFFFTSVFTNIYGLHSGMIYSLQYWMEQQGERRGSQPQYYYFLIILPMYEFLPIIGTMAATVTGLHIFWKRRRATNDLLDELDALEKQKKNDNVVIGEDGSARFDHQAGAALREQADAVRARWRAAQVIHEAPALMFIAWWALTIMIALTLAGEKMPWLGTHMTTPMILITGWYFGRIVQRIDWGLVKRWGWLLLLLFPLALAAGFRVLAGYVTEEQPFRGVTQTELLYTYNFIGALVMLVAVAFAIDWVRQRSSGQHTRQMFAVSALMVLSLITFRSAWQASFINYDNANEFIVYAHATPNTKTVINLMEDFSKRTTDGMGLRFAYDNKLSWPGVWYFRRFTNAVYMGETPTLQQMEQAQVILVGESNRNVVEPLLEDRYQRFDFKRMWWPMQDYFNLNARRMLDVLALSEDPLSPDTDSGRLRRALFNIWWHKDFTLYGEVTNKSFSFDRWPVSENFYVYIRKDYAAQVWPYGTGDGSVTNPIATTETSACIANWLDYPALEEWSSAAPEGRLNVPIGLDVAADGRVYVAEDQGFRISVFGADGKLIRTFGERGLRGQVGAFFERPHSVAVGPDGSIYVVDTWNYQIKRFNSDWQEIGVWGVPVTGGLTAPQEPLDGMWGPRDIAIDPAGNVYISDTGNKRVRVYTADGVWVRDIGRGGSGQGQLDEPTGLAIHEGRLYVADTWNRRIAVFNLDGTWVANYPVRAWYGEPASRPYLAIDPQRQIIYISDPEGGRILVTDLNGQCLGAFGRLNVELPRLNEFTAIGGIDVDEQGFVYVTDISRGRLLKFQPFPIDQSLLPAGALDAEVVPLEDQPEE